MDSIIFNRKEFRQYPRNKNYYVSKDGEVYSAFSKKTIKLLKRGNGNKIYHAVDVFISGKQRHMMVHRMVYETWKRLLKDGEQVNHKDDNQLNNNINNLYVGTQKENIRDCIKNGNRVGHVYYLTIFDKKENKVITFCPASKFIEYSGHTNKSGNLNKFFSKNWFKKRYEILDYKLIKNIEEFEGVTTMGDECSPVE